MSLLFCLLLPQSVVAIAQTSTTAPPAVLPKLNEADLNALLSGQRGAYMMVTNGSFVEDQGIVFVVGLDALQRPTSRTPTKLSCPRLSLAQSSAKPEDGKIFCFSNKKLGSNNGTYTPPTGHVFNHQLVLQRSFEPHGMGPPMNIISRARISPDGKYIASTVFTLGSSYTATGQMFSTEARIGSTDGSMKPENIEKWKVLGKNNTAITAADINLWGGTFDPTNTDRFLVTVSTGGKPRLAEGSVARREIRIINDDADIECPSYSPDGKKIAFKRVNRKTLLWSPAVLDLATGVETVFDVGAGATVDDQIEWLNDHTIIYEFRSLTAGGKPGMSLMTIDIRNANNKQQMFLDAARSPTFFRP